MRELGVGLIGTGWVSNECIKAFQKNVRCAVAAICSRARVPAAEGRPVRLPSE